tara:strand:- start:870 stop:1115 length:246 start_codon:yes stop_codon:yes gene_type:complete
MDVFLFIIAIVLIGNFFSYKKEMAKLGTKVDHAEDNAVKSELANIKQRLVVLEKIVTDKNYDLNEELSSLNTGERRAHSKQ